MSDAPKTGREAVMLADMERAVEDGAKRLRAAQEQAFRDTFNGVFTEDKMQIHLTEFLENFEGALVRPQ